jgi:putative flippase GtrA
MQRVRVIVRSMAVGTIATVVDLGILAVLVSAIGLSARVASAPALAIGVAAQFVGNKLFAFEDRSRAWVRQGVQFLGVEALGFAANLVLYDLVIAHTALPYLPVRLATTSLVYFGICLPLWSLIFRARPAEAGSAPSQGAL